MDSSVVVADDDDVLVHVVLELLATGVGGDARNVLLPKSVEGAEE
jgi:hypothetical protein